MVKLNPGSWRAFSASRKLLEMMLSIFMNWDLYFLKRANPATCENMQFFYFKGFQILFCKSALCFYTNLLAGTHSEQQRYIDWQAECLRTLQSMPNLLSDHVRSGRPLLLSAKTVILNKETKDRWHRCDNSTISTKLAFRELPITKNKALQHKKCQKHKIIGTNLNHCPIQFHVGP